MISRSIHSLLALLLFFLKVSTLWAHVENTYNLEGTFGDRQVFLEIIDTDGTFTARYCFKDEKKDNYFDAYYSKNKFELVAVAYNPVSKRRGIRELIEMQEDDRYNWSGTWHSPDGGTHSILLRPIKYDKNAPHAIENESVRYKLSLYSVSRLQDIKYKQVKRQSFKGGITVQWLEETCTGVKGFRVKRGFPESYLKRLNTFLEALHIADVESSLTCGIIGFQGSYTQELEITLFTSKVLSMTKKVHSNCSNTEPRKENNYITINTKTCKTLGLEEIFWLGEGEPPRDGSKQFYQYRRKVFGAEICTYMNNTYKKETKKSGCNYSIPNSYQFPNFYLTPKGMKLELFHYSLKGDCKYPEWSVVRFKDFDGKWNEKFID